MPKRRVDGRPAATQGKTGTMVTGAVTEPISTDVTAEMYTNVVHLLESRQEEEIRAKWTKKSAIDV